MKFTDSLKSNYEFRRLYSKGKRSASSRLVLYCRRNRLGRSRLGITVGTKLGNAVVRNKVRRRLHEIYRTNENLFASSYDIVVVARARSRDSEYSQLQADFLGLADKLGLLSARP